jgi:hypothetical protein
MPLWPVHKQISPSHLLGLLIQTHPGISTIRKIGSQSLHLVHPKTQ